MKKLSVFALVGCLAFITACSEKDVKYYQDNPTEAKAKIEECEENFVKAMSSGKSDEELQKLENDKECKAAKQALKAIKKAEREAEKAAAEKANKAVLDKAEGNFAKEYGQLDWKAFQKVYKDHRCRGHWSLSGFASHELSSEDAECEVMKKHYKTLIDQAKAELAKQPFDELIKRDKEFCLLDKGLDSPCSVWRESFQLSAENTFKDTDYATLFKMKDKYCESEFKYNVCTPFSRVFEKKEQQVIDKYAKDDELFKAEYDKCYQQSLKIKPESFSSGGQILIQNDPICSAVHEAAVYERKLNKLQYFRNPLE